MTSATVAPLARILICGDGLAADMTTAALARQLGSQVAIVRVGGGDAGDGDLCYGTVTAPSAEAFNLMAGVDERRLIPDSDTAFSWGTRYIDWGGRRAWTQGFALPFPVIDGVAFHQYLTLVGAAGIEPFVAGAQAARRGGFIHPPREGAEAARHPLAQAGYGYQFDPARYARLFAAACPGWRVQNVAGAIAAIETADGAITSVRLSDGSVVTADLYVDCTGPAGLLLSPLEPAWQGDRRIGIGVRDGAGAEEAPLRRVTATPRGWSSATPLRGRVRHLEVFAAGDAAEGFDRTVAARLGRRPRGWVGNCVGIGHAAAVAEPVTPAPVMLLERDIERLLTLIPATRDMTVERREYNRRFADDTDHAALFARALFACDDLPDGPYWRAAQAEPVPDTLARKLSLFATRGVLVAYDLEPFGAGDWTMLHLGSGRRPARHDRLADRADRDRVRQFLSTMQDGIRQAVAQLPPSRAYRAQLERYLRQGRV